MKEKILLVNWIINRIIWLSIWLLICVIPVVNFIYWILVIKLIDEYIKDFWITLFYWYLAIIIFIIEAIYFINFIQWII